jgi:hypothetical protein
MRQVIGLLLSLSVAGCSGVAALTQIEPVPVTVAEIQRSIACEFAYALQNSSGEGQAAIRDWGALVELELGVKDTSNVIPGLGTINANVGDGQLTLSPSTLTLDRSVEDKNTLAYFVGLEQSANAATCPKQGSPAASSGLEVADLLTGVAEVISAGGSLTSTASVSAQGIAANGTLIGQGTTFPGLTIVLKEKIPTIRYERTFTVGRKAGGGLTFAVPQVTMTIAGTGAGRERKDNKIKITMGALSEPSVEAASIGTGLLDSIQENRDAQLKLLTELQPSEVIVVNPTTVLPGP